MEIKELVSKSKEVIIQPKTEEGIFYDAFSYTVSPFGGSPVGRQNSNSKNYLYIISQIQSDDKSLDYVPNLIASFIKRELESGNGYLNDEEQLFENSLKKTNELIEGILKSSDTVKLDLGIAFVNKEKIAVSKIGKAKLLIYRPPAEGVPGRSAYPEKEETFDIFGNINQFSKLPIDNERFLNIISGEVKKGDRFFFFIPNVHLNPKQKLIISTLAKREENFLNSIHKIISPEKRYTKGPVPCCGIYFEMKEETKKIIPESAKEIASAKAEKGAPIMATEVAKINKGDTIKRTTDKFKEMVMGHDPASNRASNKNWRLIKPRGMNNYFIVSVIALVIISGLFFLTKGNSKLKEELTSINEKLRVSESRFLLKQNYEARKFLGEAFKEVELLEEGKQKNKVLLAATGLLNRIEKINTETKPNVVLDLNLYPNLDSNKLNNVLAQNSRIFINDSEKVYSIQENETKIVEESGNITLSWIKNNKIIVLASNIKIINLEENKINELKKKFKFEPLEMKDYEDNLYFLGTKNIYKISNALASPLDQLEWLKLTEAEKINGNFVSFDLDSAIFVLTDERKLATLFKGEVVKSIDLDFDVRPGLKLTALENEFLVVDKEKKLARLIDDLGGLKTSYNLSDIDVIKDSFFDKDSRILYLLSPTKIWSLKI